MHVPAEEEMAARREASRTRRPYAARMPAEERKEQLLDAALRIIVRDGYDKVSVDAIAREAEVTRPVVYGVFDGLGSLLYALLDRHSARALGQMEDALAQADLGNPEEFLTSAAAGLMHRVMVDPVTWRPILLADQGTPPAVRERIEAGRENVRRSIAGLIDMGVALRGLGSLDTEVASHAVLAVLEHFGKLLLESPPRFEPDRLLRSVRVATKALLP